MKKECSIQQVLEKVPTFLRLAIASGFVKLSKQECALLTQDRIAFAFAPFSVFLANPLLFSTGTCIAISFRLFASVSRFCVSAEMASTAFRARSSSTRRRAWPAWEVTSACTSNRSRSAGSSAAADEGATPSSSAGSFSSAPAGTEAIVDGQQRLTTLTILLSVLRDLSEPKIGAAIHNYICQTGEATASRVDWRD
jgi:hypothetical protein